LTFGHISTKTPAKALRVQRPDLARNSRAGRGVGKNVQLGVDVGGQQPVRRAHRFIPAAIDLSAPDERRR
jgi:hypothetical protein